MAREVVWIGELNGCQVCKKPLNGVMIDGKIRGGCWANMCQSCHRQLVVGLGVGKGQKYHWNEERQAFIKVEG